MHRITVQYPAPGDPEEFDRRYVDEHVPLVHRVPGLSRFLLSHPRSMGGPAPYLVAELWFDTADDLAAALASPEMAEAGAHVETLDVDPPALFVGEVVDRTS